MPYLTTGVGIVDVEETEIKMVVLLSKTARAEKEVRGERMPALFGG